MIFYERGSVQMTSSNQAVLELKDVSTIVNRHTPNQTKILKGLNLTVYPGDFITVIGSNGLVNLPYSIPFQVTFYQLQAKSCIMSKISVGLQLKNGQSF